ncbi:helix-turn-helix domain-containing protein [Marinicella gelatinilytica]|uniref:helix-turn-helix domain-containing protein n=1 Tax=Marinicella gelatinilytica TaxID=2996017 RepID=UPI002260DFB0|nr:helix-turn-helix transcriptional regulator [Marinicella gelatinilytica]MCX7545567.1 helix-turn-helix transcriptional regulator [Marinicella gelatinilytica]
MKLSEKIKLLRTNENMTQPALASKAGIEQSYLSKLENDKGSPSYDVIYKIAQAFGMTGMELINSLSQSYIEKNLSHIPEVAAEYASVRNRREKQFKRRFILASLVVVFGVGLVYLGSKGVVFNEKEYIYESLGVIKQGETPYQFNPDIIHQIDESTEDARTRIQNNISRIAIKQISLPNSKGSSFITEVNNGQRLYKLSGVVKLSSLKNELITTLGVMLIVSGLFIFAFCFTYKPKS